MSSTVITEVQGSTEYVTHEADAYFGMQYPVSLWVISVHRVRMWMQSIKSIFYSTN